MSWTCQQFYKTFSHTPLLDADYSLQSFHGYRRREMQQTNAFHEQHRAFVITKWSAIVWVTLISILTWAEVIIRLWLLIWLVWMKSWCYMPTISYAVLWLAVKTVNSNSCASIRLEKVRLLTVDATTDWCAKYHSHQNRFSDYQNSSNLADLCSPSSHFMVRRLVSPQRILSWLFRHLQRLA